MVDISQSWCCSSVMQYSSPMSGHNKDWLVSGHQSLGVERSLGKVSGAGQGWGLLSQFSPFRYFFEFFSIITTHVIYWISRLYLTGVAAA